MKHELLKRLVMVLGGIALWILAATFVQALTKEPSSTGNTRYSGPCDSRVDLDTAIQELAAADWAQADRTKKMLLDHSKDSLGCRKEIINALIHAMTKPNLNFVSDRPSYFLWLHGSILLGTLKAGEALDLLIDHLDLNDGEFSASMIHQPAVLGVLEMGAIGIPKLDVALQNKSNRNTRLAAALCLSTIGGHAARNVLERALRSEPDRCVKTFIQLSLKISKGKSRSKTRSSTRSVTNAQIDLRRQLLMAFRCDN